MQEGMTEEQVKFIERKKEHIKTKTEPMIIAILGEMLKDDLPYFDTHYIHQRSLEVIEKTIRKVVFVNDRVQQARKLALKEALKEFKEKQIKLASKEPKDATDIRDQRCERISQLIVDSIFTEEVLFSNNEFVDEQISNDDEVMLYCLGKDYVDSIYSDLILNIGEHERRANRQKWGKDREEVTMGDLDKVLKEIKK